MSVTPRRTARWYAAATPAIPAPQITTSAVGALITGRLRPARPLRQAGRPAGAIALEFRKSPGGLVGRCPHLEARGNPAANSGFAQLFCADVVVAWRCVAERGTDAR